MWCTTTINWEGFYSWPLYVVIVSVVLFVLSLILLIKRYQLMIRRRMEQRQQAEVERMELERAMNAETIRVPTTISGSGTMVEMKLPPNANVRDFRQDGSTMHGTHEQTQMDQPYVMREPGVVMPSTSNVQPIQLGVNHESQQPAVQYTFNNNLPPSIV
ncbi:hypothetical protein FDP41_013784 [Naegleria fowleri]|uniref:Uncharacterized protein n=1 Tax=Naegleria fowleri TaxID=5763 RepID=A0A6A5C3R7_NAEFO|nr:uncharacterized protein FDP41_013784 [Naegleria fowleri]KAF0980135.1 hypothetical protein FDP41_013784 [Naegleria fowleri]